MKINILHTFIGFASGANISVNSSSTYSTGLSKISASSTQLQQILQIVFGIIGGLAVLIILFGAFKFITSSGNPENIAKARETIIYAVVGLVVAALAEVIVSFVLFSVKGV
jgi:hypothetical protein